MNSPKKKSAEATPHGRRRARHAAVQAIYQWQISKGNLGEIDQQFLVDQDPAKVDKTYFSVLLHGVPAIVDRLDEQLARYSSRAIEQLTPVELAILRIGAFELGERLDVPVRVVINEAIELAKKFGADDSHRFVNSILDKLSLDLRARERHSPKLSR